MTDASPTGIDFYWRPGCGFCASLDRGLTKAGVPLRKHNIWDSPADAATVREWANGNETVPTVVIDDVGLVNPSADDVLAVLSRKAPHLVPEGWEPPQPGRLGQAARRLLGG
ncbi:MAG: glutaredoxin domain-containing protein [Acidimicrobiales bacterium]